MIAGPLEVKTATRVQASFGGEGFALTVTVSNGSFRRGRSREKFGRIPSASVVVPFIFRCYHGGKLAVQQDDEDGTVAQHGTASKSGRI